jgi:phospholipase C
MSTPHSANVYIKNLTGGTAVITMCHQYSNHAVEAGTWTVAFGDTAGPLTVHFETGFLTGLDYWYCSAAVMDGPNPGIYVTEGSPAAPEKECELESKDANSTFTNTVDTRTFHMNQPSGGCTTSMSRTGPYSPIRNVFLLMLENHSFDHIFGFSGINGVNGLSSNNNNVYNNTTYPASNPAVDPMTTDPNHEFLDTMEQLCGPTYGPNGQNPFAGNPNAVYPAINNSGFVINYATVADEDTGLPAPNHVGDVMTACAPAQVPVMIQLAQAFAVCDNWNASIPGPTWPNRLFSLCASSSGMDDSPTSGQIFKWEMGSGIAFQNGSIVDLLKQNGLQCNFYNDRDNDFAPDPAPFYEGGGFPLAAAIENISKLYFSDIDDLATDLQGPYPYQFTLIEPNYGNAGTDTYKGGSSQHPEDSLWAGEALVAAAYNAIRNSALWNTSLLIITYDEHGGYYDHVAPGGAPPPGDTPPVNLNTKGFNFTQFGVRVPAVIVSPLIAQGVVDHAQYDHTSILSTIERLWRLQPLTQRDKNAADLTGLITTQLRTDCPQNISAGSPPTIAVSAHLPRAAAFADPTPLAEQGTAVGHFFLALKTDIELSDGTKAAKAAILERAQAIKTRGQLRQYFAEVLQREAAARALVVQE